MSTPAKSYVARSLTVICLPSNSTLPPADFALASGTSSEIGNFRSARIPSRVSPTAPVAPAIATLYAVFLLIGSFDRLEEGRGVTTIGQTLRVTRARSRPRHVTRHLRLPGMR